MEQSTYALGLPTLEQQAKRYIQIGLIDRLGDFTAPLLLDQTRRLQMLRPTGNVLLALSPALCPASVMAAFMNAPGQAALSGIVADSMRDIDLFSAGPGIEIPSRTCYALEDPLLHTDRISSVPTVPGRTVLTINEAIALSIQTEGKLLEKNAFIALGSRIFMENGDIDQRVPTLGLVDNEQIEGGRVPELGWGKWVDHQKVFTFASTAKRSAE